MSEGKQRARLASVLRSLGPAVTHVSPVEAFRAGLGALVGLGIAGLFILSPTVDLDLGLYLVAPFGASSVLLFAVPNSPLAQPWSAMIGNIVAALVGVAVCLLVGDPALRIALAVGLAITAMILCRAVHPPAGAVAMTAAMNPEAIDHLGFWFALSPIAVGTLILVIIAAAYARLTGRHYPFRQFDDPGKHLTKDPAPAERLGLSEEDLHDVLERYRQSFNIGVEDFARIVGAAERRAAAHAVGTRAARTIMSQDLVTVAPETSLSDVARLFHRHRFVCLPVVEAKGAYRGVIFQIHLISEAFGEAWRGERTLRATFRRLARRNADEALLAGDIMETQAPRATPDTPVSSLIDMMADGTVDAVPVLEGDALCGIVTRTDLMAAMARHQARAD